MSDPREGMDARGVCPNCRRKLDAATHPTKDVRPSEGDLTVCIYCRCACVFEAGRRGMWLRPMTPREFDALPVDAQVELLRIGAAIIEANASARGRAS